MRHLVLISLFSILFSTSAIAQPTGDYQCTQSQIFQFNETGTSFGVAAVLSTDIIFELFPPKEGGTLIYQSKGTTYLIDAIEADWSAFKYRVVYSGDLRSFTGFCKPLTP